MYMCFAENLFIFSHNFHYEHSMLFVNQLIDCIYKYCFIKEHVQQ